MENFTHYRLFNHKTGKIIYLLSIDNHPDYNHSEKLEKKKIEMMYKYNIPHEDLSWETLPS